MVILCPLTSQPPSPPLGPLLQAAEMPIEGRCNGPCFALKNVVCVR
jgi:hypothetical protein